MRTSPGWVPAAISTADRPRQRRHLHARPQGGERRGHVEGRDQIVSFADEALVFANADENVEVARRRPGFAGVPLAAHPYPLPVGDACRYLHLEPSLRAQPPPAAALPAGLGRDPPVTVACLAGDRSDHLAERGPRDGLQLSGSAAALARLDRRPRLGTVAVAVLAALDRLEGDLDGLALGGLEQLDLDGHRDVAARGRAEPAAGAAEEGVEEISDRAEPIEVGGVAP